MLAALAVALVLALKAFFECLDLGRRAAGGEEEREDTR